MAAGTVSVQNRAETACQVLFLPKEWLGSALQREPALPLNCIGLLSERIRFLNHRTSSLAGNGLRTRTLRLPSDFEQRQKASKSFRGPCPMTRLAEALAVGRASLYRVLAALEAEGVILRRGREIEYLKNKEVLP